MVGDRLRDKEWVEILFCRTDNRVKSRLSHKRDEMKYGVYSGVHGMSTACGFLEQKSTGMNRDTGMIHVCVPVCLFVLSLSSRYRGTIIIVNSSLLLVH